MSNASDTAMDLCTKGHVEPDRSSKSPPDQSASAADRLLANKEHVLSLWEERLRKTVTAAGREPSLILINTLPAVLDQLAEALSPEHPRRTATDGSTVGQEHGGERVRLTHFRLEDLITEYKILRQVLSEVLEENSALSIDERTTLNTSVDQMIMEACTGYALVQSSFRDQFFATVAHDLRNPLSAAQASAALIARDPHAKGVANWATRIIDNISRADRMVRDLLDAMRVQTGARLTLEIKPCDLVEVVRHSIDRFHTEAGERVVVGGPGPSPWTRCAGGARTGGGEPHKQRPEIWRARSSHHGDSGRDARTRDRDGAQPRPGDSAGTAGDAVPRISAIE